MDTLLLKEIKPTVLFFGEGRLEQIVEVTVENRGGVR